uniref:Polyprotein n=1 Tax=Gongylonema pulchrum TaxID=637853 RepID=A0A183F1E4_9BILA
LHWKMSERGVMMSGRRTRTLKWQFRSVLFRLVVVHWNRLAQFQCLLATSLLTLRNRRRLVIYFSGHLHDVCTSIWATLDHLPMILIAVMVLVDLAMRTSSV